MIMSQIDLLFIEEEWKDSTTTANKLLKKQRGKALLKYKSALKKAEKLMSSVHKCLEHGIPVMPIYLISCNNLAETYFLLEQWDKGEKMLKRGIFYIVFLNQKQKGIASEQVLSKGLHRQLLLYKDFCSRSKQPEKFEELYENLKSDISFSDFSENRN